MSSQLSSYRDPKVWQKAMDFALAIHELSKAFPDEERFGLTAQIRRAVYSVPSNIAEGYGRIHRGDYVRHLSVANGSLKEVETQLILAQRLGFVDREHAIEIWNAAQEVGKLLLRLIRSLENNH